MANRWARAAALLMPLLVLTGACWQFAWGQSNRRASEDHPTAEFHFIRMEYVDLFRRGGFGGFGRGWWMQDWPEADIHFAQGIKRLTRIDVGEGRHFAITDDRIYDYPWIYATQTGYWDLRERETSRLRDYLLRGGFLVTDDFHGPQDWEVFRETMARVFPEQPIVDIDNDHSVMNALFSIKERVAIPGLRHLRRGAGGQTVIQLDYGPPIWRAIHDPKGHMVVAVNFNQDIGDAWEHADLPLYPAEMTGLAYRFGINYIIYAMTH